MKSQSQRARHVLNRSITMHKIDKKTQLAVGSRVKEYFAQNARLRLESAIHVQPLSQQQVQEYIQLGKEQLVGFGQAIEQDKSLREMASSPLWLNLMAVTYADFRVITYRMDSL